MVSIHAPREGCDSQGARTGDDKGGFNSRTPGGVRRYSSVARTVADGCFNSRTPGGVRLFESLGFNVSGGFQFTHPGRGAT